MKLVNKTVAVVGGAGFIGSHLSEWLAKKNSVVVVDSLENGNKLGSAFPGKLAVADITKAKTAKRLLADVDCIFYLASVVGVEVVARNPFQTMDTEIKGVQNTVSAALDSNVKKLVYASSSSVYGKGIVQNAALENQALSPKSSYAVAKLACEFYLKSAFEVHGLATASARIFNAYGPNQDERMVIPRFFRESIQNNGITVYEDGSQTRDFTYVDDICEAFIKIAESPRTNGESVNIATGKETTINALAAKIKRITGSKSNILHQASKGREDFEVSRRFGSSAKLFRLCGFRPIVSLDRGLEKIWAKKYSVRGASSGV